jgi:hypothetical protein
MERIASFEQFKRNGASMDEYNSEIEATNENSTDDKKHYMFFRNVQSIKHYIDEIMKMDKDKIDELLEDGHDWAADHISTAKTDIEEVAEWLRDEFEDAEESDDEEENEPEETEETEEEPEGEEEEKTGKEPL